MLVLVLVIALVLFRVRSDEVKAEADQFEQVTSAATTTEEVKVLAKQKLVRPDTTQSTNPLEMADSLATMLQKIWPQTPYVQDSMQIVYFGQLKGVVYLDVPKGPSSRPLKSMKTLRKTFKVLQERE